MMFGNRHIRSPRDSIFPSSVAWVLAILALTFVTIIPNQPTGAIALSNFKYPDRKVALVTGSNKGIGYEIAKNILSHKNKEADDHAFVCILGCRNPELGKAAADRLASETQNSCVDVVTIDLMDQTSIEEAVAYISETYGRCDVLINNAAVCYNDPTLYGRVPHTPFAEQAQITIATNFFGTLALTQGLLPLLEISSKADNPSRIINIASSAGRLSILPSLERQKEFSSKNLTIQELEGYMNDFCAAAQEGNHASQGWPNTGYGVSKVGIIAMTKVLARQYPTLIVNSVDPGYCATDQNNQQGVIPAARGAVTPYLLAIIENERFTSKHWYQEQEIAW